MENTDASQGVSNCYVFKSRLQEYAQKVGLPTPVYQTIKEGPSHEPTFRSTVIVNDVRYDSLTGFFNRKAAEQSAAEIALVQLSRSGEMKECITQPVHETGLCKNLLQEYAQKMNYAMPLYSCLKDEKAGIPGRRSTYSCTVEIGAIRYIGASASTKKEAELKAARTALLAIQSSEPEDSEYTVLPYKKKTTNPGVAVQANESLLKPKKGRFKKKFRKKKKQQQRAATNEGCDKNVNGEDTDGSLVPVLDRNRVAPNKAVTYLNGTKVFVDEGVLKESNNECSETLLGWSRDNVSVIGNGVESRVGVGVGIRDIYKRTKWLGKE